jgi:hypothetical protein
LFILSDVVDCDVSTVSMFDLIKLRKRRKFYWNNVGGLQGLKFAVIVNNFNTWVGGVINVIIVIIIRYDIQ